MGIGGQMTRLSEEKQERIIEAVRQGLEGDAAVEFLHESGFAMSRAGIARHLKALGGWARIGDLIEQGKTNVEIVAICSPQRKTSSKAEPSQGELFGPEKPVASPDLADARRAEMFETRKMAIKVPADLYEAIRLAAKAEGKSQNQLIVDALTAALSQIPQQPVE